MVVLPSVPVTPTTASSRLGSPYHQPAAVGEGRPAPVDDELEPGHVRNRALDDRGDGAGGDGADEVVVAVGVRAADRDEQVARPDEPGNLRHAVDRPFADRDGVAAETHAIAEHLAEEALARQPLDQPAERPGTSRIGPGDRLGDRPRGRPGRRTAHRRGRRGRAIPFIRPRPRWDRPVPRPSRPGWPRRSGPAASGADRSASR